MPHESGHTFLLQEGLWQARGVYYDQDGRPIECDGKTSIIHLPGVWINEGYMRLLLPAPIQFENHYEIKPVPKGQNFTSWKSVNPDLGELIGRFVIVEETILSPWRTADGEYSGAETLIKITRDRYLSRGCAFKGENMLSSWAVEMRSEKK